MTVELITAVEGSTMSKTIADLVPLAAEKYGDQPAFRFKSEGEWRDVSFVELAEKVKSLALGLIALGLEPGERVAILANTCPEWSYFDYAILGAGLTVIPIYQTNAPEECKYVIEDSDAKAVVVENDEQLDKIRQVRGEVPTLEHVIVMDDEPRDDAMSMAELIERGSSVDESEYEERYRAVGPGDIFTLIYTSGTTGPPKGCVITEQNFRQMLNMLESAVDWEPGASTFLWLPLAHAFARLGATINIDVGGTVVFCEAIPKIIPNLAETKPQYFPSVPRIFEKIYAMATQAVANAPKEDQEKFWKAIEIGDRVQSMLLEGKEPTGDLKKAYEEADERVFKMVRDLFGGNVKFCVTGAAPIAREILDFFWACGILLLEGWGMTETATAATTNRPDDFRFGSVGKPLPGTQVKIADDGEILLKGPNIFQGYWKLPEATDETLVDGWLYTGDLGRLDEDGFLYITGRKKDIIITAGGKNITPANLENGMKQSPYISQAVAYGDRRPFLTALITLDEEEVAKFAKQHGLDTDPAALTKEPEVIALVQEAVDAVNEKVARVEHIRKFTILPHDLSQAAGELTPTLKVKRNVVYERYADELDAMYRK